jgi:ubiquinone/menaquinone biosynthesis C-methylase UbiE
MQDAQNHQLWENIFSARKWGEYPAEDLIRFVARNFYQSPNRSTIKILELGCGTGANLWFIAKEQFSVYGIDCSKTAISLARKKLDKETPNWMGELRVGDFVELPFEDNYFDAVIDQEAVYCNSFEKSKKIYDEAARVLKSNGLLYVKTFACGSHGDNTGESAGYNAWIASEGPLEGKGFSRFTAQSDINDLLAAFKVEELELNTRTINNLKNEIKEWNITARKV